MATAEKTKTIVPPFGVGFDHPRNADFRLQSIPGMRVRSAISPTTTNVDGSIKVLVDKLSSMPVPTVPGMELHVNPEKLEYVLVDPLCEDQEAQSAIKTFVSKQTGVEMDGVPGVPSQEGKLDVHRMKSLCRELMQIVTEGHAKIVKGPTPQEEDIENLPGHFLLNPGMQSIHCSQPTFEKDWDKWYEAMTKAGA